MQSFGLDILIDKCISGKSILHLLGFFQYILVCLECISSRSLCIIVVLFFFISRVFKRLSRSAAWRIDPRFAHIYENSQAEVDESLNNEEDYNMPALREYSSTSEIITIQGMVIVVDVISHEIELRIVQL